jgi:hypothetical protein
VVGSTDHPQVLIGCLLVDTRICPRVPLGPGDEATSKPGHLSSPKMQREHHHFRRLRGWLHPHHLSQKHQSVLKDIPSTQVKLITSYQPAPVSPANQPADITSTGVIDNVTPDSRRGKETQDKLETAIHHLNFSVERLFKISSVLRGTMKPESLAQPVQGGMDLLSEESLNGGIALVEMNMAVLIRHEKETAEASESQTGFMAATGRFLRTTVRLVTPALKNFLIVAVQGSAVNSVV